MTLYTDGPIRIDRDLLADIDRYSNTMPTDERVLGIILFIAVAGALFWAYRSGRKKLAQPVNRAGFIVCMSGLVLIYLSLALCIYDQPGRAMVSAGLEEFIEYGVWDGVLGSRFVAWQMILTIGLLFSGAGAMMVWLYQPVVQRLVNWIRYGD